MDRLPRAGSTACALQAQGLETKPTSAIPRRAGAGDPGRGNPGKPVGAVVAAASAAHVARLGAAVECERGRPRRGPPSRHRLQHPAHAACRRFCRLRRGDPQLRGQPAHPRTRPWRVAAQRADGPGAPADARRVRRARRVGVSVEGAGTLVAAAAGLGWRRVPHRSLRHRRAAVSRPGRGLGGDHGRLRQRQRNGTGSPVLRGRLVPQAVLRRFPGACQRGEAMRLRGGSGHDVSGHHTSVGAGPVAVMGAAPGPDRRRTCARRRRRRRAAEPRHAIGGGAAFRACTCCVSGDFVDDAIEGRQYGWIASGSRQHFN